MLTMSVCFPRAAKVARQTSCRVLVLASRSSRVNGAAATPLMRTITGATAPAVTTTSYSLYVGQQQQQQQQRWFSAAEAAAATPPPAAKEIIPGIGKGKTSTGLTGLAVEPDWYNVLLKKFQLLLDSLKASDIPETAQYRMDVTKWANFVIATVKANPDDPERVEDEVRMGQVEELIEMADDEMVCMKVYNRTRMWELVDEIAEEGFELDFNPNPLKDEMAPDSDPRTRRRLEEDFESMLNAGLEEDPELDEDDEYKEYRS